MAQSRLHSFGTIFTRVKGLLRAGAMKESEKPIWYEVYEAFPPRVAVRDFPPEVLSAPIKPIFYREDKIRAKFYNRFGSIAAVETMTTDPNYKSVSQQFIDRYREVERTSRDVDEDDIFNQVAEQLISSGVLQTSRYPARQSRRSRSDEGPQRSEASEPNEDDQPKDKGSLDISDLLK